MKKDKSTSKLKLIWELFIVFLRLGAFTFGGGYAMIALIEKDVVEKKKWITSKDMLDILAIAETTPGVIALNSATFVGAKVAGFWGALVASVAVMLPAMVIITIIGTVIDKFANNPYVKWAFLGVRAAVVALILNAVVKLSKMLDKTIFSYAVFVSALALVLLSTFNILPVDIVFIIIIMAIVGIVYGIIKRKKEQDKIVDTDNVQQNNKEREAIDSIEDNATINLDITNDKDIIAQDKQDLEKTMKADKKDATNTNTHDDNTNDIDNYNSKDIIAQDKQDLEKTMKADKRDATNTNTHDDNTNDIDNYNSKDIIAQDKQDLEKTMKADKRDATTTNTHDDNIDDIDSYNDKDIIAQDKQDSYSKDIIEQDKQDGYSGKGGEK